MLIIETIQFLLTALILFLAAGTIMWLAGWIFLILLTAFSVGLILWLLRRNPGLIKERMGFKPNQKTWDKVFLTVFYVLYIAWLVLMPLDSVRFHWSHVPVWLQAVGTIAVLCSFYIWYLTFWENPYLSSAVRIQEERGQTVITTGPYRYVRHPMYAGGILFFLGSALLLGSWYGVLMGLLFTLMIAGRAVPEERMLRDGLEGYDAYMAQVKYRFIPGVW